MRSAVAVTLAGNVLPALAALVAFPLLDSRLGTDLFGFFLIGWATIGFSSLLDLGMGRAIAYFSAHGEAGSARRSAVNSAFFVLLILAVACGLLCQLALLGAAAMDRVKDDSDYRTALSVLLAGIPLGILTSGVRAVIEGHQHFTASALIRTVTGVVFIALPATAGLWTQSALGIALGLIAARILAAGMYLCYEKWWIGVLDARALVKPPRSEVMYALRFSGWVTASTIAGSAMAYMDRMALGMVSTLSQTAYYAAPFELISRVLLIPGAIVTVTFPKLSSSAGAAPAVRRIVRHAYLLCFLLTAPVVMSVAVFAKWLLNHWMGSAFAEAATNVVRLLAPGIVMNAMAHIPVAALQALGRPDIPGKVHLAQFVPTAVLFLALTHAMGASGAAAAWSIRAGVDALLMSIALSRLLRHRTHVRQ